MQKTMMTGGSVISKALKKYDINTVFSLAGASHTYLLDALEKEKFNIILSRHETGTVGAADGFARVTRKIGVALIVSDQGIPNAITGILSSYEACSPVLIITVRRLTGSLESHSAIDHEKLDLVKSITKWSRTVYDPNRLQEYINTAYRHAISGRKGPVVLQVPQEFLKMNIDLNNNILDKITIPKPASISDKLLSQFINLINESSKPLIIVGSGAYWSDAGEELRNLSSSLSIPVFGNAMGRGLVNEDDKLGWSWAYAQSAAKSADLIVCIGVRLTQRLGYGLEPKFSKEAKFIQIDIQPEEIGRNRYIDLPIVADVKNCLLAINTFVKENDIISKSSPDWVNKELEENKKFMDSIPNNNKKNIHPYQIARELMKQFPNNAIYVGDGADIQNWMHAYLRVNKEGVYIDHYPLGSMGIGTPLAIGVAAGLRELSKGDKSKERPIIHVTGDGAFGFYLSEYNAAAVLNYNITTIISNDGAWGTEKHGQRIAINKDVNTTFGDINYSLIAKGFGCYSEHLTTEDQIRPSLQRALAYQGPSVLDIVTDPEAGSLRKLDPRVQTVQFTNFEQIRKNN
ncbi:thiamine pyrophosphate-binding protein [Alphaproteobacteria bacterium]|nr:thiamine pyrophosphate-binding protein [Alphaproteobacteria bacterium]